MLTLHTKDFFTAGFPDYSSFLLVTKTKFCWRVTAEGQGADCCSNFRFSTRFASRI